jgi:hypothetical protein
MAMHYDVAALAEPPAMRLEPCKTITAAMKE